MDIETASSHEIVVDMARMRSEARAAKDFVRSDLIRELLKTEGIRLEDTGDGTEVFYPFDFQ